MEKKRVGLITTNKVLAQSIAITIGSYPDLPLEPFLLLNSSQAVLGAEVLGIDVAVVDAMEGVSDLCEELRKKVPECRILLFAPQDNPTVRNMAIKAMKSKTIDDFVMSDASLDYMLAKLIVL